MKKDSKIFLSINNNNQSRLEKRLIVTLERAGFSLSDTSIDLIKSTNDNNYKQRVEIEIQNSFCSVHFIGKKHFENSDGISLSEYHFNEAKKRIEKDEKFKTFIWMPGKLDDSDTDKQQMDFINRMQHHLSNNMILSRVPSAIQFVEDVRLILEQQEKKEYKTNPCDVFLIYNQTDEKDVSRIKLMLSGVLNLIQLNISPNSEIDYEEFASQQMNVSKLSVIYYKNAADWAYPFIQQIWKKVGGAAAKSPILFVCDAEASNQGIKKISMPNVTSFIIQNELIPLEIKMQFDSLGDINN
jgi:hypothetical protein